MKPYYIWIICNSIVWIILKYKMHDSGVVKGGQGEAFPPLSLSDVF